MLVFMVSIYYTRLGRFCHLQVLFFQMIDAGLDERHLTEPLAALVIRPHGFTKLIGALQAVEVSLNAFGRGRIARFNGRIFDVIERIAQVYIGHEFGNGRFVPDILNRWVFKTVHVHTRYLII